MNSTGVTPKGCPSAPNSPIEDVHAHAVGRSSFDVGDRNPHTSTTELSAPGI